MSNSGTSRLLRREALTALGIIVLAAAFLVPTFGLRPISALLPAAMLAGLIVLSAILLVRDQRAAARGEAPQQMATAPGRVAAAFALVAAYAAATDAVGFYPSTAVAVPLVAWVFGYRSPLGLLAAAAIVVGTIWLIFDLGMSQDFPGGRLWR